MNHVSAGCVGHPSTACGRFSLTVPRARILNQMVTAPSVRGGTMCHAVLSCPVWSAGGRHGTPAASPPPIIWAHPSHRAPSALSCQHTAFISLQAGGQESQFQEWHTECKLPDLLTSGLTLPTVVSSCHCLLWWFLLSFWWTSHIFWIICIFSFCLMDVILHQFYEVSLSFCHPFFKKYLNHVCSLLLLFFPWFQ